MAFPCPVRCLVGSGAAQGALKTGFGAASFQKSLSQREFVSLGEFRDGRRQPDDELVVRLERRSGLARIIIHFT